MNDIDMNLQLCRKLFEGLKEDNDNHPTIIDYFSLKTLQLIENFDIAVAQKYYALFKEFSEECVRAKLTGVGKYEAYFFALSNLLENEEFFFNNPRKEFIGDYLKTLKAVINNS